MKIEKINKVEEELKITGATLLSFKEANTLLTQEERAYYDIWGLRSPLHPRVAHVVGDDGTCGDGHLNSNIPVRPALKIDISNSDVKVGDEFIFGGKKFKVISPELAWMHRGDIGNCAFRKDKKAENANVYEYSDAKKFVDTWFEKVRLKERANDVIKSFLNINARDETTAIQSGQVDKMKIEKIIKAEEELKIAGATLLSKEEAKELLTKEEKAYKNWRSLRSSGDYPYNYYFRYASYNPGPNGFVRPPGTYGYSGTTITYYRVRPALKIDISNSDVKVGDVFDLGGKEFKVISPELAWMHDENIGKCTFAKRCKLEDVDAYEYSNLKWFIDRWFEKTMERQSEQDKVSLREKCARLSETAKDTGSQDKEKDKGRFPKNGLEF